MTSSQEIIENFFRLMGGSFDESHLRELNDFIANHYREGSDPDKFIGLLRQLSGMHPQPRLHTLEGDQEGAEEKWSAVCEDRDGKWFKAEITLNQVGRITSFGAFPTLAPRGDEKISSEEMSSQFSSFVEDLDEKEFAGNILIAKDDEIILEVSQGYRNRKDNLKHDSESRFNVGSMSKMFTATAIGYLVDKGLLRVDQNVGSILDHLDLDEEKRSITIHQLLTHTSGLGSYWDDIKGREEEFVTIEAFAPIFEKASISKIPHGIMYSNLGFQVLGLIIEKITEKDYYAFIHEIIIDPLEMTSTGYPKFVECDSNLSLPYRYNNGETEHPQEPVAWPNSRGSAAGGCISTNRDILKYFQGMIKGKILTEETLDLFTSGKVNMTPDGLMQYAYGFGRHDVHGIISIGHNGGAPGINGDARFLSSGHIIVVFANRDPDIAGQVVRKFISLLLATLD